MTEADPKLVSTTDLETTPAVTATPAFMLLQRAQRLHPGAAYPAVMGIFLMARGPHWVSAQWPCFSCDAIM
jgi:hypothetical protein